MENGESIWGILYPVATLSGKTYLSESLHAAGAHGFEVAFPADSPQRASLFDRQGLRGQSSEREVDRLSLGSETVTPHYFGARLIVNVYVGECHRFRIHQEAEGGKAPEEDVRIRIYRIRGLEDFPG